MLTRLAGIVMLCSLCAAAQTVEGAVANALTGEGIPGAQVTLLQRQRSYSAITDADGHFRIEGVHDGAYLVRYSAKGFGTGPPNPPPVQVRAGSAVRIQAMMIPLSRISGRVIDARGDLVPKARVELTTSSAQWTTVADAKGNFELPSAFPGESYTLAATPPPEWKPPGPYPDSGQARSWALTFYPGVAFRQQAAPIAPQAGSDLLGIEIKLLAVPVHAVRGVLLRPDGTPAPRVAVALRETGPRTEPAYRAESKANGTFEFQAVADGDWRLSAHSGSGGAELRADAWIEMNGHDIEGLKPLLNAPFIFNGRTILETPEGMPPPGSPEEVLLIPRHAGLLLFSGPPVLEAQPEAEGHFRFGNVYPGTYDMIPGAAPPLYYLDSMRLGDSPLEGEVELSAGAPEVTILYKTNGGTVRGTVEKCGGGSVYLLSAEGRRWGVFFSACDGSGRFQINAVRPGEYYAQAVPAGQWSVRAADAASPQPATRVTVRAGETTEVDLALSSVR
ncbi:MAG TPA: carboxypeptidase-like regulatory domain-containing protein [Bryobacteraceae bacterium]|nr:carboxypeptidase-like regulatory domain-containing protein [Bryobacteraceae bacterium]